jgi:putative N6-adenine-specific DNA methylase
MAAAMIQLSHWHKDRALIDPFCGTGTIPIEAAFIAQNRAPGLKRSFASEKWPNLPKALWQEAWQEALDLWDTKAALHIYGSDIDPSALTLARTHAFEAGVEAAIHFQRLPVSEVRSRFKYGHLIANPPYGERLGGTNEVEGLYLELGETYKRLENWSLHMLTTHQFPERLI